MKSLFLKIFLSYWVAQALFLALAILITLAVRERGESAIWEAQQATVLKKAVQTYEQSGPAEVRRYLEEVRDSLHTGPTCWTIRDKMFPGAICRAGRNRSEKVLLLRAATSGSSVTPSPFRRQALVAASGHRYTLVAFLPPGGPFGPGGVPGLEHSHRNYFVRAGVLSARPISDCPGGSAAGRYAAVWRRAI